MVREARAEDFAKAYALLLGFENPGVTEDQWRQLFVDHSGLQNGVFGYVMVDGEEVVGFLGATVGSRTIRGRTHRVCNLSNWIVKQPYRGRSLDLLTKVLDEQGTTVTVLSPAPHVLKIFEMLRFELLDTSERIIIPSPLHAIVSKAVILTERSEIERELRGESLTILRHHSLQYNKHVLVRAPEGDCYVLMNRSWKTIARRIRIPMGRIHHISSRDVFLRYADRLALAAVARFGVAALIVNERALGGRRVWNSIRRPGGPRIGAFKSEELHPEDIDGLYSEAVLLNY